MGQKYGPPTERPSYFTCKGETKPNRDSRYLRCLNWPIAETIRTPLGFNRTRNDQFPAGRRQAILSQENVYLA